MADVSSRHRIGLRPPYFSEGEREATYQGWLHHYNHHRTHTGIGGISPISRVHNVRGNYT